MIHPSKLGVGEDPDKINNARGQRTVRRTSSSSGDAPKTPNYRAGFCWPTRIANTHTTIATVIWKIKQSETMVRVWYEPPPGGPRSHLNRGAYGVESAMEPLWMKKLARMRPASVIVPAVGFIALVAYLPLSKYFGTLVLW
jgi:hypothetical protein